MIEQKYILKMSYTHEYDTGRIGLRTQEYKKGDIIEGVQYGDKVRTRAIVFEDGKHYVTFVWLPITLLEPYEEQPELKVEPLVPKKQLTAYIFSGMAIWLGLYLTLGTLITNGNNEQS